MGKRMYKLGQEVKLNRFETQLPEEPVRPWVGPIVKIGTKFIKCRPAALYRVRLADGQEVDAFFRDIEGAMKN